MIWTRTWTACSPEVLFFLGIILKLCSAGTNVGCSGLAGWVLLRVLALPKIQIELSMRYRRHLVIVVVGCHGCWGENNLRYSGNMLPCGWWQAEVSIASPEIEVGGGRCMYITWVMEKLSLIAGKNMRRSQKKRQKKSKKKKNRANEICTTVIQLLYVCHWYFSCSGSYKLSATAVPYRLLVPTPYQWYTVPVNSVILSQLWHNIGLLS